MIRLGLALVLTLGLGCGGDNAKELCQHMKKLAEKAGDVDTGDMEQCMTMVKAAKKEMGDELFAKYAACLKAKDTLEGAIRGCDPDELAAGGGGGGGESASERYMKKSKTTEAQQFVKKMYDGARAYYMDGHYGGDSLSMAPLPPQFPGKSVGPTPPLGSCCKGSSGKCTPDAAHWTDSTWVALMFSVDDPHYYSYEYKTDDPTKGFTVSAYGDLDCDGEYSTFRLQGIINEEYADGPPGNVPMLREKEME